MFLMAAHAPERFGRPRQVAPPPLMHFDYRGMMLGRMLALLEEQAGTVPPGGYPDIDQMRHAAAMLGIDLGLFFPPDAAAARGERDDAAAPPND